MLFIISFQVRSSWWVNLITQFLFDFFSYINLCPTVNFNVVFYEELAFGKSPVSPQISPRKGTLSLNILFLHLDPSGLGNLVRHFLEAVLDAVDLDLPNKHIINQDEQLNSNCHYRTPKLRMQLRVADQGPKEHEDEPEYEGNGRLSMQFNISHLLVVLVDREQCRREVHWLLLILGKIYEVARDSIAPQEK